MHKFGANEFLDAFSKEWDGMIRYRNADQLNPWEDGEAWDDLMLSDDGLLKRVMDRLLCFEPSLNYRREFSKIDVAYVGGKDLFRTGLGYPSELHALIEHEKGNYPDEEMWKLLYWRSPLKVIIFFDYPEDEKNTDGRKAWVNEKLSRFAWMYSAVNEFHNESETDYVFLVGTRSNPGAPLKWLVASNESFQPTPLKTRG